jgi:hypothetical protein
MNQYLKTIGLIIAILNFLLEAVLSDDAASRRVSDAAKARAICIEFTRAERDQDWSKCYSLLHESIKAICRNPEGLCRYTAEMLDVPDTLNSNVPVTSSHGKGGAVMFVKLSAPSAEKSKYTVTCYVLKRNEDGSWGVYFAFPTSFAALFAKVLD